LGRAIGIDANVFLCVLLPGATKADKENVDGSEALVKKISEGKIRAVTSSIVLSEIAWAFLREGKSVREMEGARYVLEDMLRENLEIVHVSNDISWQAGKLRRKYYTKENMISYQDAIYLATCLDKSVSQLFTTDPHLLITKEISVLEPKSFMTDLPR